MSTEPRYPYLTFDARPSPGGRVSVTVSVNGPAREEYDNPYPRYTSVSLPMDMSRRVGVTAVRDTWAEAAAEAFNHPATQAAMRAFDAGPVVVDCWGAPVANRTIPTA